MTGIATLEGMTLNPKCWLLYGYGATSSSLTTFLQIFLFIKDGDDENNHTDGGLQILSDRYDDGDCDGHASDNGRDGLWSDAGSLHIIFLE